MEDHPEILEIVKGPGDQYTFGSSWHTDQMFNPQPAKATMLYAKETPSSGGDTIFANMHDAYDALSDGMKSMLADVKSYCSGDKFKRGGRPQPCPLSTTDTATAEDGDDLGEPRLLTDKIPPPLHNRPHRTRRCCHATTIIDPT